MLTVHHLNNSRSQRVLWLLEELGLDYDIRFYTRNLETNLAPPELEAVHPLGKSPVLTDDDNTIIESGAIIDYVLRRYGNGRLMPEPGSASHEAYLQWLHYAEGMLMPPVNAISVETIFLPPERRNEVNVKRATKLLQRMFDGVETHLQGREYLAGDFSAADIMSGHSLIGAARFGVDLGDRPNLRAYLERLQARPAFQKAAAL